MAGLDPAWIALIGTVCGGMGLKVLEHWLGKSRVKVDDAATIRNELRVEIASLRDEVNKLETEVNDWRGKYYDLRDSYAKLNTEYRIAIEKIESETALAKDKIDTTIAQPPGI